MQNMTITPDERPMSDEELLNLSDLLNMDFEVTEDGTIRMMTPAGNESSQANAEITRQLGNWWHTHKQGHIYGSDTKFLLPNGAKRGPDAAYLSEERAATVPREAFRTFAPIAPNFVIELLSRTDSLEKAKAKMRLWVRNGVELGWLIDPYEKRVYVATPKEFLSPVEPSGGKAYGIGCMTGFELDLNEVWRAYE